MAKWQTIIKFAPGGLFSKMILPAAFRKRQSETRFKQEWKIPLGQYGMAKYQRGNFNLMPAGTSAAAGVSAGMVVMTGQVNNQTDFGNAVSAGYRFNNDGSVDAIGPGAATFTQIDPGEWWSLEPETDIGSSYDVRALSSGALGTWDVSAAADDTWIAMSSDRIWRVTILAKNSPDTAFATRTFEVRTTGSGSALDSGLYQCTAEN